jgi:crotonobetainyl-CoA:carnitine CoA-transferase CaiB-like acyl-CoA transferase
MADSLLAGVQVVDLAGEPAQMTGRILADLGADVVKVEPPGGDPLRRVPPFHNGTSLRFTAWNAGKTGAVLTGDDPGLARLLAAADVVLATPGWPGTVDAGPDMAPLAVWVDVTPFGADGPRSHWRAGDLGVMAASGNMFSTGDPDRPPVRCTEPSAYAHVGPEAAVAALTALASGRPQHVDVSIQETVLAASMASPAIFFRTGARGRRLGDTIGRTREIWPCADGFVSFGLRGGKARAPSLRAIAALVEEDGLATPALAGRDWDAYNHQELSDDELRAIEEPLARWFARHTMAELYELAARDNLMLAPANSPKEIYASAQLAARDFFGTVDDIPGFPMRFVKVTNPDGAAPQPHPRGPAPALDTELDRSKAGRPEPGRPLASPASGWPVGEGPGDRASARIAGRGPRRDRTRSPGGHPKQGEGAWSGTRIVEFGAGAAGPIATRYFAEHGATVIRVESRTRPDFLRTYAVAAGSPHGLEGSDLFDVLNAGKLSVTLNLKHPAGADLARRLVASSDAVAENFAPRALAGLGLDYPALAAVKPDLVMVSACLQGQTGPHRHYPGFGGQGAALSGYNFLTGWPDRAPVGPFGTITDSLAPRFTAAALAAGLLYRRRTGRGLHLDLAQVEAALYSLSPWLLDYTLNGTVTGRDGNRSPRAVPHGAFPCRGEDRWVAVAAGDEDDWERLAKVIGTDDPSLAGFEARRERVDEVEEAVAAWTSGGTAAECAESLQAAGVEAVPVADFGDVADDPQLAHRSHFVPLTHGALGEGCYERNGFRLSATPSGYRRPGPTLGQDNEHVLGELLGLSAAEQETLAADGALD